MPTIAVLADIHGNLAALEAVLDDMERHVIAQVWNLGDHASGPLWPRETTELLMQMPWLQIAGNHDRQVTTSDPTSHGASDRYAYSQITQEQCEWLGSLPAILELPGCLLCHGTPTSDTMYLLEEPFMGHTRLSDDATIAERLGEGAPALVMCGHSHLPRIVKSGSTLIINPGSVGLPAYEDDNPRHIVENGSPQARYALLHDTPNGWLAEFMLVEYDYERAARRAEQNDRPDWARALRTGFMD